VKRFLRVMAWIVGLPVTLILLYWASWIIRVGPLEQREPYYVEQSPDGRYKIIAISDPSFWSQFAFAMPGQGGAGDSPGIVMLVNAQGRELARAPVGMMQIVTGAVRWYDDSVSVVSISDWSLPPPTENK
jgi:hypothetical protein